MNKLVLLSKIREEKTKNNDKLSKSNKVQIIEEDSNKSYVTFKEKFDLFQNKEGFIYLNSRNGRKNTHSKYEKRLNKIMKRIFSLQNKVPFIGFLNSIYGDELSTSSTIKYIKNKDIINNNEVINLKDSNYNVRILVEDEYRKLEYEIQFQTRDDQNTAITISKVDLTNNCDNVLSLNKKKREYEIDKSSKDSDMQCLIMLNCNIEVPDVYEVKSDFEGKNIDCKVNIIKSWKYDFKQLAENNMYLLFPMKVLDLKKRLLSISDEITSKSLIKDEICRFFKDMNIYLKKIKEKNLITDKDINELNLIAIDLLNHFIGEKNNIIVDIEATLKDIVV